MQTLGPLGAGDAAILELLEEHARDDETLLQALHRIIQERLWWMPPDIPPPTKHDWEQLSDGRTGRCKRCGVTDLAVKKDGEWLSMSDELRACIPAPEGAKPLRLIVELAGRRAEEVVAVVPLWEEPEPDLAVHGAQLERSMQWCIDTTTLIVGQNLVRFALARLLNLDLIPHGGGYSRLAPERPCRYCGHKGIGHASAHCPDVPLEELTDAQRADRKRRCVGCGRGLSFGEKRRVLRNATAVCPECWPEDV